MESKSFEYMNKFENVIYVSNQISALYTLIAEEEINYGRNKGNYSILLSNIRTLENIEKNLMEPILNDSSILYYFKDFVERSKCERLKYKLYSDYDILEKIYDSTINEKYDDLVEKKLINITRDEFKKDELNQHKNKVFLTCIFNLIEKKKYVKILDYYINNARDGKSKKMLVSELYTTISCCKSLEDWFFGDEDNIDCLLIDCDEVVAINQDLSLESYLNLRNNHFINLIDNFIHSIIEEDINYDEIKTLYETNLISMILSLDAKSLSNSYRIFREGIEINGMEKEKADFIDDTYSKSLLLLRKIK